MIARNQVSFQTKQAGFSYPSVAVLREAHRIADKFPPKKARAMVREYFEISCRYLAGPRVLTELVETFFTLRERWRHDFLAGSGLEPDPEIPGRCRPGSWRLTTEETAQQDWQFVIRGVRTASGESVAVRLSVMQFNSAGAVLKVVRKAVNAGKYIGLKSAEWRRIWEGFDYRDGGGGKRRARGLRLLLRDQQAGGNS